MKLLRNTLLETFVTVVECGGFTDAQYALGITQSAISIRIRDLETALGYRICERGRGGFRLTERGEIAYRKAGDILRSARDFDAELLELRGTITGDLRIGTVDAVNTLAELNLAQVLKRFLDRPNEVQLEVVVASPTELTQKLITGDLHVAIAPFRNQVSELTYTELCQEEHRLYCGRDHPLFDLPDDQIDLDVISEHQICQRSYNILVSPVLQTVHPKAVVANMEAMAMMIETGHYLGPLPVHFIETWAHRDRLRELAPDKLNWNSTFYLATRPSVVHRRAVEILVQDIIESCLSGE
ncbi:CysJI operon transcriptional activator [Ruegeria denitrificans]|uniref:CysJI operon transcriptional activator n=1 Tax=Ruegeria denitrificans TaxID=1715692 RepID=A0A0P1J1E1_9RHOB|nr:LysR family transcriptional regulator [Ruegeria denitrificans]CUK19684.1 CysJI operon transcriptional activator [Ruegeria denitrificans]